VSEARPGPVEVRAQVACFDADRLLCARHRRRGETYLVLPGGHVEPGETLVEAARRETLEEAGVPITVDGLLRVEHSPGSQYARLRAIFTARPADDTPPKSEPDEHTLEAGWYSLDEMRDLPLRGDEVEQIFRAVDRGAFVAPLSLLTSEGAPWT